MIKDDSLWKGILENVFDDFLRFFFRNADDIFDMESGFQFLDKELEQLFPADDSDAPKFVDKLVKVYTKAGAEEWMLIHVEVQGYNDKDFAKRMFTYFYRILDRYNKPVTAFAIFTDSRKSFHPRSYVYQHLGTKNTYEFNTYKILEQDEITLAKNENPFAIVVLTVLLAIKKKRLADEDLLQLKLQILRNLYRRNISDKKMRGLNTFLNLYVHFAKPETKAKFEQEIQIITSNKKTMGIVEMVLDRAKEQGVKQGIEKTRTEFVKNLLLAGNFTITQIANLSNAPEAFVLKIKDSLN